MRAEYAQHGLRLSGCGGGVGVWAGGRSARHGARWGLSGGFRVGPLMGPTRAAAGNNSPVPRAGAFVSGGWWAKEKGPEGPSGLQYDSDCVFRHHIPPKARIVGFPLLVRLAGLLLAEVIFRANLNSASTPSRRISYHNENRKFFHDSLLGKGAYPWARLR
jgi:hypothetical protein